MKQRIITAIVAIAVFVPFLIFSHTHAFTFCFFMLTLIGTYEMLGCIGLRKKFILSLLSYAYSGSAVLLARLLSSIESFMMVILFSTLVYVFAVIAASLFSKGRVPIDKAAELFMMMFYIALTFSCILLVRDSANGGYLYLLVFVGAWITDSGAYFAGVAFGKHKLIPDVSPKKTVEGAVGGIVLCIAFMALYAFAAGKISGLSPNYIAFLVCGAILSVVSMIGDLVMSLLKRKHGIKDYGVLFPGHGGVLDRFDSVIACAPFLMILVTVMHFFS